MENGKWQMANVFKAPPATFLHASGVPGLAKIANLGSVT
jgi:hypothetical protein